MFYGHFCAHGRLNGPVLILRIVIQTNETGFGYIKQSECITHSQVIVILAL